MSGGTSGEAPEVAKRRYLKTDKLKVKLIIRVM